MHYLSCRRCLYGSIFLAVLAVGCSAESEIRVYQAKKEQLLSEANRRAYDAEARGVPHRLWGAIVLRSPQAWFFKVVGPNDIVANHTQELAAFIESVKFVEGHPTYTLPEGWKEGRAVPDRFATLHLVSVGPALELSITQLSMADWEPKPYLLQNVNRWRGQLGLSPATTETLARETRDLKLADGIVATIVEGEGRMAERGAGPMAGMMPPDHPPVSTPAKAPPAAAAPAEAESDDRLSYKLPEGWSAAALPPFAVAAFTVREGSEQAEVSISALPARAAEITKLLPNVNRWRGQLQLGPLTEEEVQKLAQPIAAAEMKGTLVELQGPPEAQPREAMLGAMFITDDMVWFVKLRGGLGIVEREKNKFNEFVASLRIKNNGQ